MTISSLTFTLPLRLQARSRYGVAETALVVLGVVLWLAVIPSELALAVL